MKVPFLDLKKQYETVKTQMDSAIADVIADSAFIKGKYVDRFEKEFASAYGVKHCIGVANGTDSIYIILKMLGIGAGDEVITVANTWISTSETITQAGARPVFIDHDEYFTIMAEKIEEKITANTKAVIAVHLYGQPADLDTIKSVCEKRRLFLIEDCAQAHFAKYEGKNVGTFGIAASFSFYPGKNLGAYGDAGAIITNDDELAKKMRMYANHGSLIKHAHEMEGINSRLDGLQAAVLSVKLPYIENWNRKRAEHAARYSGLLKDEIHVVCPAIREKTGHIFHLYVVLAQQRNELQSFLKDNEIETQVHYPTPLPFLKAYSYLHQKRTDFPTADKYQSSLLSLPMYPELEPQQVEYVASKIKEFYRAK